MSADDFKAEGNKYFSAGEYEKAVEAYTKAIALKEDHVFFSNRSASYASLHRYSEALADAARCVEINPSFVKGYSRKGAALYGLGKLDDALAAYQAGLKVDPSNASLKEEVDRIQAEKSMPPPMDPFASMFNESMWMKLANNPLTREYLADPQYMGIMKDLQANPSNLSKHINDQRVMASLQVLLGLNMDMGAGAAQDAPREPEPEPVRPAHPAMARDTTPASTSASASVGEDGEEEEEYVDEELEREKAERAALKAAAEKEKELGTAAYKAKDFAAAIAHYTKAFETFEDAVYLMNLTAVYFEQKDYERCLEEAAKIVGNRNYRLTPQQKGKLFLRMGNAASKLERWADAIQHYKQSVLEEGSAAARKGLKEAEEKKKKADEAAYLNPELSEELKEKGNAAVKEGNWVAAIEFYTDALKRNPQNYRCYANRALCFQKLMRWDRAIEDCDKAVSFAPTEGTLDAVFIKAIIRKGKVQHFLKNYGKAIETYREGLERASEEFKGELEACIRETQAAIYTSNSGEPDEQRLAQAMADPEVAATLNDPFMKQVLEEMGSNPASVQKYMADERVSKRLEKLIAAGIIRFG